MNINIATKAIYAALWMLLTAILFSIAGDGIKTVAVLGIVWLTTFVSGILKFNDAYRKIESLKIAAQAIMEAQRKRIEELERKSNMDFQKRM